MCDLLVSCVRCACSTVSLFCSSSILSCKHTMQRMSRHDRSILMSHACSHMQFLRSRHRVICFIMTETWRLRWIEAWDWWSTFWRCLNRLCACLFRSARTSLKDLLPWFEGDPLLHCCNELLRLVDGPSIVLSSLLCGDSVGVTKPAPGTAQHGEGVDVKLTYKLSVQLLSKVL